MDSTTFGGADEAGSSAKAKTTDKKTGKGASFSPPHVLLRSRCGIGQTGSIPIQQKRSSYKTDLLCKQPWVHHLTRKETAIPKRYDPRDPSSLIFSLITLALHHDDQKRATCKQTQNVLSENNACACVCTQTYARPPTHTCAAIPLETVR